VTEEAKKKSGTRFALFGCGGCLVLMFGFMIIGALTTASMDDPSNVHRAATAPVAVAEVPAAPAVPIPASEQAFCDAVQVARTAYKDAMRAKANELKLSKIRTSRAKALVSAAANRKAEGWVGKVKTLATTGEGHAVLVIELPCDVRVGTWNNALSDIGDNTLVPQSSPLFDAIASFDKGSTIGFSGRFSSESKNGFKEQSLTEYGSMTDPVFVFRFTGIRSVP